MRGQLERFFRRRRGLAIAVLIFAISALVFVVPKMYFSLDQSSKKMYWGSFLFSLGIFGFIFFGPKSKKEASPQEKIVASSSSSKSYQMLLDEIERCLGKLKQYRTWAYCYLIMGWIILWIGRWTDHPPYNHPIFPVPVFLVALLGATRSLEEENELDVTIAKLAVEGIGMERKRPELKSSYFHDLGKS